MRIIKRAYLYVTRKKGKSILLFFILLIMATFVLTGLSTQKASQEAQKNLREALGGEFYVSVELSESNPYFRMVDDGEGALDLYTELPVTQDMINAIMEISGIEKYDASAQTLVSTNFTIFPGNVPLKGELNNKVYARTVAGTENNSFFQSGIMELVEGKHITGNESNAAVISRDMADQNNLQIGDSISLQADEEAEVKIIGIYEIRKPDPAFTSVVTYEKLENQIFIDTSALQSLFGDMPVGFYEAAFSVYDPAQLDSIMSEVKGLSAIDWRAFEVAADNQTYLDAAAPLQKLQALMSSIIWVIVLVSTVILSLILAMWGRSRIHETGVFLSLGIGKMKIIGQYLTEVLMIAVIAFGCSYFTSSAVAGQLANGLLQQNIPASEEQAAGVTITKKDGFNEDVVTSIKDDDAGKMYTILGPSGSGKTTLLSLIGGLDTPQKGEILFEGGNISQCGLAVHRRNHVSLIFQNYNLIDYMTPIENVALTAKKDVLPMLLRLGLTAGEAKRNVMKLSGGQQQRVAIARALASDTPVILADEPTGNLDEDTAGEITDILKESAHELNKCVIVVTHSNELAAQADVVLNLKRGSLHTA